MSGSPLLQDLAVVVSVAAVATLLCHRFKQPVVIGYLLAGIIAGPHTPPFSLVRDIESIRTMADLGIVFLMFALGLEFNLPRIRKVGIPAALAGLIEVSFMLWAGFSVGRLLGWSPVESVFLGALLSISSTTLIVKLFTDLRLAHEGFAQFLFGILILEDVAAVLLITLLSGLGTSAGTETAEVFKALFKTGLFVVLFIVLGLAVLPRLLDKVAGFKAREALGIVALGLCLAGAWLGDAAAGSAALGAFLAGAIVAASGELAQIEAWIHPVRDMFSALFFVSVGMLVRPELLWGRGGSILLLTAVLLAGKSLAGTAGAFLAGRGLKDSVKTGVGLAQIGEFSLVIAGIGAASGLADESLYAIAASVSFLSALAAPHLLKQSDAAAERVAAALPSRLRAALRRYGSWTESLSEGRASHETAILSRYLIRLAVYLAFSFGIILAVRPVADVFARFLPFEPEPVLWAVWTLAALAALPVWASVSKYGSHFVLLMATRGATASKPPRLLRHLNIRLFYDAFHLFFTLAMGLLFLVFEATRLAATGPVLATAVLAVLVSTLGRRRVVLAQDKVEHLLDEVIRLATSEPVLHALLGSHDHVPLFGMTEPVHLVEGGPSVGRRIADLDIRRASGASIIAVYRQGRHMANPQPLVELRPDDVVVLYGEAEERQKAVDILLGGPS
ncbi:MAG TPA: hypothetical protein DCM05_04730 [Elusimicrobia bacterium]|nr:hypothetical protein [Elusimicrobiota bacterium]